MSGGDNKFFFGRIVLFIIFLGIEFFCWQNNVLQAAGPGDVVINEICWMGTTNSTSDEWLELKNNSAETINLSGWVIVADDGTPNISLNGEIAAGAYYILERTDDSTLPDITADLIYTGALEDGGEKLFLKDESRTVIDTIDASSGWPAGDSAEKKTMERNNSGDWQTSLSSGGTPQADNSNIDTNINEPVADDNINIGSSAGAVFINNEVDIDSNSSSTISSGSSSPVITDPAKNILISEVYPAPQVSTDEFIELYNSGAEMVDLSDWSIQTKNKFQYFFPAATSSQLAAGQYLALRRADSHIALNNEGDAIKLFPPHKSTAIKTLSYSTAYPRASFSLGLIDLDMDRRDIEPDKWYWTTTPTPGEINVITDPNQAPVIVLIIPDEIVSGEETIFDASDSYDLNGDNLRYRWEFGDGIYSFKESPEHIYQAVGSYKLKLGLSDGVNTTNKEWVLKVNAPEASGKPSLTLNEASGNKIIINEIFPNPLDEATAEWIELKNIDAEIADLSGWSVDDSTDSGSRYQFKTDILLNPGEFYLLKRSESKIALNNSNDTVRLFDPSNQLIDSVSYGKTYVGSSYGRSLNNQWSWSSKSTPGQENILANQAVVLASAVANKITQSNHTASNQKTSEVRPVYKEGARVLINGIVSVLPGVFGVQYFYITDASQEYGWQIYNYKKDFPELNVGDNISVAGVAGEINGEPRIKTASAADIKVLSSTDLPEPLIMSIGELTDDNIGALVQTRGEIASQKGQTIYLDDGENEIPVYLKTGTGIEPGIFEVGKNVDLIGVVNKTQTGLRILPRSARDVIFSDNLKQVLGTSTTAEAWVLASNNKSADLLKYFFIILGASLIISIGWFLKSVWLRKK